MFLGYILVQLLCNYGIFPVLYLSPVCVCAAPNMAVFCNSLIPRFPRMWLRYFENGFEMVPFVPVVTGITFLFLHSTCVVFLLYGLYILEFPPRLIIIIIITTRNFLNF